MSRASSAQSGFSLIEAVVALAIASFAFSTLYQTVGGAVRAAARVQVHEAALVLTRAHLDSLGADGILQVGDSDGTYSDGLRWRLSVTSLSSGALISADRQGPFWIVLETYDRSGVSLIRLETAKIARIAP